MAGEADVPGVVDGRRARADRSRTAVVDAVLDLFREGVVRPSVDAVAERAGVSRRSVFRHYEDLQSLYAAAVEQHVQRITPLVQLVPCNGSLLERIETLVAHRARLYEEMTPVRVVTERLGSPVPMIDEQVELGRVVLREQLIERFRPELESAPGGEKDHLIDALEVVSSWSTWHVVRTKQCRSVDDARQVMVLALRGLLG